MNLGVTFQIEDFRLNKVRRLQKKLAKIFGGHPILFLSREKGTGPGLAIKHFQNHNAASGDASTLSTEPSSDGVEIPAQKLLKLVYGVDSHFKL
ncbi:MAG: hypothetical protein A2W09_03860 [Deltaproteobacteria bacterium RBG_16_50_11]|nr:MAG: hypothetical protein A2W09_03860 [Deltaproteobacteria bacterium RBG_16_50_11]